MKRIAVLLFGGAEELDVFGPYDVFGNAADVGKEDIEVFYVAEFLAPVECIFGTKIIPHYDFQSCPKTDVLVVPGGDGTRIEQHNDKLLEWVRKTSTECDIVCSVCTGARITLASGFARGKRMTTHWSAIEEIRNSNQDGEVLEGVRFVKDGNYISAAGVSAGIDMALWLVGYYFSPAYSRAVQREMQYEPSPPCRFEV